MNAATTREWDKWNELGVTKFLYKKQLNEIMKRNPDQKIVGTRWVLTEKVIQGTQDYKAKLVGQMRPRDRDTPSSSRPQQQLKTTGLQRV